LTIRSPTTPQRQQSFGWTRCLDIDDGAVTNLAQIDDSEVLEIEQNQQITIFHRLLRIGVNNHAKPREAQAKAFTGKPDPARCSDPNFGRRLQAARDRRNRRRQRP